ncbi:alpha/beta hydrolase [Streptomyces sp. NPDC020472]|uniref:alpha/beta hydrolase n=1 Tax=Streptomyces sp. NPDC020472 TaxID=3365075 RepID=UPI0037B339A4
MALLLAQALTESPASAAPLDPTARGGRGVASVTYDLGDRAYRLPETGEPVEMAAIVHYPKDLGTTPRPLVVQLHGWHETCADRSAEAACDAAERAGDWDAYAASQKLFSWPCAPGTRPIANERGYDYLGEELAAHGFIVVSIRANGINASSVTGDGNASARADLIDRHLALWQKLNASGRGGLGGAFRDAVTGKPQRVDFHRFEMPGANHNYFNTQWSPAGGQVAARDDAGHDDARPGQCTEPGGSAYETQLSESAQRHAGAAYITAFFQRYLTDHGESQAPH